jgi:hypothetical protein
MNIKAVDVEFTECYTVARRVIQGFEYTFLLKIVSVVADLTIVQVFVK